MRSSILGYTLFLALGCLVGSTQGGVINDIEPGPPPSGPGSWFKYGTIGGGSASIQSLTGLGGNLENNAPLPTGAARLQTGFSNGDKAEIGVSDTNFTTVDQLLGSSNIFDLSYAYHKQSVQGGNSFAAPSIKLSFYNGLYALGGGDGWVTLVYEPTWNQVGSLGSSTAVAIDTWTTVNIDADNGLFWQTGGFGISSSAGGPPLKTLNQWKDAFDTKFEAAELSLLSVGIGTYNQGQVGYFDDVRLTTNLGSVMYDFEAVPEPATLAIFGIGTFGACLMARRRKTNVRSTASA